MFKSCNIQTLNVSSKYKYVIKIWECHQTMNVSCYIWLLVTLIVFSKSQIYVSIFKVLLKLGSILIFADHVNGIARVCIFCMQVLHHVSFFNCMMSQTPSTAVSSVHESITVIQCYSCASEGLLDKLQCIQNHLAHIVCNYGMYDQTAIEVLCELHWLMVKSRITLETKKVVISFCALLWSVWNDLSQSVHDVSLQDSLHPSKLWLTEVQNGALDSWLPNCEAGIIACSKFKIKLD